MACETRLSHLKNAILNFVLIQPYTRAEIGRCEVAYSTLLSVLYT